MMDIYIYLMMENEEWSSIIADLHCKRYEAAIQKVRAISFERDAESMSAKRITSNAEKLREIASQHLKSLSRKDAHEKLLALAFFQDAFAVTHDCESKLAMRYEALLLEEANGMLKDAAKMWMLFGEECLQRGYGSISFKGFDKAIQIMESNMPSNNQENEEGIQLARKAKEVARASICTNNVQVEANSLMRKRARNHQQAEEVVQKHDAAIKYKIGTKRRNLLTLLQSQSVSEFQ